MWLKKAVCVRCGRFKHRPLVRCTGCGYHPGSDYEMARALILTETGHAGEAIAGRSRPELKRIAAEIRSGRPYLFDPNEEQVVLYAHRHLQEIARKKRIRNRALGIGAALLIAGILYLLFF